MLLLKNRYNELGIRSLKGRTSVPTGNLHHPHAKVKPKKTLSHAFFTNNKGSAMDDAGNQSSGSGR